MSYLKIRTSNERNVEVQLKILHIRTPGEPEPREFTCSVTGDEKLAIVELGAAHVPDPKNHEIMTAIREALGGLGFKKMRYSKDGRKVTVRTIIPEGRLYDI